MDLLLEHLERTAERLDLHEEGLTEFVRMFDPARAASWPAFSKTQEMRAARDQTLRVLEDYLTRNHFSVGRGVDYERGTVEAELRGEYGRNQGWLATVPRLASLRLTLVFRMKVVVDRGGSVTFHSEQPLLTLLEECAETLRQEAPSTRSHLDSFLEAFDPLVDPLIGPGEPLPMRPHVGTLRDYSGCADIGELRDLTWQAASPVGSGTGQGGWVLPLGIYAFTRDAQATAPSSNGLALPAGDDLLLLGRYRSGAPMEYNGTLVIAPQNSGKTELILRWAKEANAGGYSTFIVDVKGNMHRKLAQLGLQGNVHYFSTDPLEMCERLNLLQGLDPSTAQGRDEIEQMARALLPDEGLQGEARGFYLIRTRWLRAMIQVLKLHEFYHREEEEVADLGQLYRLATDEEALYTCLLEVRSREQQWREEGRGHLLLRPGIDYWINELAVLIDPEHEAIQGGQREARYTYQNLTIWITTALEPFSRHGTLYEKVRGWSDFTLQALNAAEPVTIILAAREQDTGAAETILAVAINRLQHVLFDRRALSPDETRPVLLLLDETRRIRNFRAGEYITFARDARAGCVLVYQSITQIKSEEEIYEILENVGTQIYLGSLTGKTAQRFLEILPQRSRPVPTPSLGGGGSYSTSYQLSFEQVPYFSTYDLYRLPAGDWPALVYIKDHPSRKPFLVDMDRDRIARALARRRVARSRREITVDPRRRPGSRPQPMGAAGSTSEASGDLVDLVIELDE